MFIGFWKRRILKWMWCAINFEFIAIYMTIICYKVVLHQFHVGGIRRFHKCHKYGKNNLTLFNETLMPVYKHTNLKGKGWKLITQSVLGWSPSSFLSTLKTQKQNRFRCCDMFGHKNVHNIVRIFSCDKPLP